jgi:PAS domain S-box-containing protein
MTVPERKGLEEKLRRSESYLAEPQTLTHTGSWVWRLAGRDAVYLSEEWYRKYGFDPAEGMPGWGKRLQRVHPEDRPRWQGIIERAIVEKSDYEMEFRILLPSGTVKHIRVVGHPVLNAFGDLLEFVGSSTDITKRNKRASGARKSALSENAQDASGSPPPELPNHLMILCPVGPPVNVTSVMSRVDKSTPGLSTRSNRE